MDVVVPLLEGDEGGRGSPKDRNQSCVNMCGLKSPSDKEQRSVATRKLSKAVVFCLIFMVVEVVGGIMANSLAILADAAHLLSDVASFAVSLFAIWAAGWEATPRQSYGYYRLEILGALVSIQIIWLITGILVYEAIDRLIYSTVPVNGKLMFCIATVGLIVNLLMVLLLDHGHSHAESHTHGLGLSHSHGHGHAECDGDKHSGGSSHGSGHDGHQGHDSSHNDEHSHDDHAVNIPASVEGHGHSHSQGSCMAETVKEGKLCRSIKVDQDIELVTAAPSNINVRGAYLHVLGDLIQSIGVMIAGAVIWYKPEWQVVDLLCTLLFSILVLVTTIRMLRDIVEVLMESTPREIDATKLEKGLLEIDSVVAVHELHIWAITVGKTLLACHVMIEQGADHNEVLNKVIKYCQTDYKISHVTVQVEVHVP